ncbi:iron ABC transporter permease [Gracilinema caldarium]|uniref:ABC transporter permease n=1 Tax=Gracilinema caldarium TaxID=215591 RepID=UPI0026EAE324|nr:iron ABC transporter permease [Gracilinema caldarium]
MVPQKKWFKLLGVGLLFAVIDFWIYSSLIGSFRSLTEKAQFKEITLFAKTAPKDANLFDTWIMELSQTIEGSKGLYVHLSPDTGDFINPTGDKTALSLWEQFKDTADFKKGLESVYYLEPYAGKQSLSDKANHTGTLNVFFAPVPDENSADLRGALVVFTIPGSAAEFENLLRNLCLLALLLFVIIYSVVLFARDPLTGYGILILFGIALAFIAYPLLEAVRLTFVKDGIFTWEIWKSTLSARYLVSLWGSMRLGIITASISTIIGFLFAFVTERTSIRGKRLISTLATMPVISPPFSLTLSIILLFGNNGLITKQLLGLQNFSIYGLGGLVLVQTIGMFPIAFLTLSSVLKSIDSTVEDAAMDLNAGRFHTFWTITLPLAMPGILSAWLLVFTNSLADFANPLLLAGSYKVLSVEAYIEVTGRNNLGGGAALSLLLLLPTLTAFFTQRYWVNRKSFVTVTGKPSVRLTELASKPVRIALTAFVVISLGFIVALYGTIVAGCFVKNWGIDYTFTTANIGEALSRGWQAIRDTVTLATIATPLAGIIAMAAALILVRRSFIGKRILEVLLMTPFAVPGTLVGIAYILAFNKPPLLLVGTAAIIVINYIIRELPVGMETGIASLRQIDPSIEEAAQDLGADMPTVFKSIVLPLIRPAFLSSMSYTFVRSMTAVSAVIFLISARWYHLTVQIYNFSENLRFGLASVLATTLILIVLAAFGIMRLIVRDQGLTEKTVSQ